MQRWTRGEFTQSSHGWHEWPPTPNNDKANDKLPHRLLRSSGGGSGVGQNIFKARTEWMVGCGLTHTRTFLFSLFLPLLFTPHLFHVLALRDTDFAASWPHVMTYVAVFEKKTIKLVYCMFTSSCSRLFWRPYILPGWLAAAAIEKARACWARAGRSRPQPALTSDGPAFRWVCLSVRSRHDLGPAWPASRSANGSLQHMLVVVGWTNNSVIYNCCTLCPRYCSSIVS